MKEGDVTHEEVNAAIAAAADLVRELGQEEALAVPT